MTTQTHALPARPTQTDIYLQVLSALILRDMRSRFGGSYWGYLAQMMWPVVHVMVIFGLMLHRGLDSPMGDSPLLFVATGAVPFLAFKYISREMLKGYNVHRSLTWFPQVKRVDTMAARALVEIVSSFMGIGVILVFLISLGVDPVPVDFTMALTGYVAAMAMGIAIGVVNIGIVAIFPFWAMIYMLITIILYMTSGVMFMACYMPEDIYTIMRWNPMVQIVEWVRLGYEPNLPIHIDYLYVCGWIFASLTLGFLMDRYVTAR